MWCVLGLQCLQLANTCLLIESKYRDHMALSAFSSRGTIGAKFKEATNIWFRSEECGHLLFSSVPGRKKNGSANDTKIFKRIQNVTHNPTKAINQCIYVSVHLSIPPSIHRTEETTKQRAKTTTNQRWPNKGPCLGRGTYASAQTAPHDKLTK